MRYLTLSLVAFAVPVLAQPFTSPRGLDATEGNASFIHWTGSRRFQQIDYTQAGAPFVISSIAWRRNGGSAGTVGTRTFDFQIDLGDADFGRISHTLDENFLPGTRTTVFNQPGVTFPDWSTAIPGPAPFDFQVMLSAPHVYLGFDALVIDFAHTNNSTTSSLATDREFVGLTTPPAGTALGTGCVATGRTTAFSHTAYLSNLDALPTPAYGIRLRMGGANAPATGGVLALLDVVNLNLPGLLCTTLYPAPTVIIPMASQTGGSVTDVSYGFGYLNSLLGAVFYTQLVAPDAGQAGLPIVASNGRQTTVPTTASVGSHRCSYGWYGLPSSNGGVATHFIGGGLVMQLQ